jgi:1,4-dihydroxy-2-naphthoyl-CoA hydrolase
MAVIWFSQKTPELEKIRASGRGTMVEHLGIDVTAIGDNYLEGTMPVDHRTKQPYGLLHGGASMVLAETLGSVAANIVVDSSSYNCVGLEINGNHLRSATEGIVTGRATPIHLGGKTQVWEIKISQGANLICISRLTMAILEKKKR